jgi:hypothetical protein
MSVPGVAAHPTVPEGKAEEEAENDAAEGPRQPGGHQHQGAPAVREAACPSSGNPSARIPKALGGCLPPQDRASAPHLPRLPGHLQGFLPGLIPTYA